MLVVPPIYVCGSSTSTTDKNNHIMDTTDQNVTSKKATSTRSQKTLNMQKYRAMASVEAIAERRNTDRERKKRKRKEKTEAQQLQKKIKEIEMAAEKRKKDIERKVLKQKNMTEEQHRQEKTKKTLNMQKYRNPLEGIFA
mmetsp:Transcript_23421/g.33606  ORF Transcript_23421/g.33606 Transcript_23421/m.33606 type:complete len:140 (+) Transcript_23421:43-462(+)